MFCLLKQILVAASPIGRNLKRVDGQTILEYALVIVLVALAVLFTIPGLTNAVTNIFSHTSSALGSGS